MTEALYSKGTRLEIFTKKGFHFRGRVINETAYFLVFIDDRTSRQMSLNFDQIERIQVLSKQPPDTDRDKIGGTFI